VAALAAHARPASEGLLTSTPHKPPRLTPLPTIPALTVCFMALLAGNRHTMNTIIDSHVLLGSANELALEGVRRDDQRPPAACAHAAAGGATTEGLALGTQGKAMLSTRDE
jgi:hypothetical protein